jgi:hypothetical protein
MQPERGCVVRDRYECYGDRGCKDAGPENRCPSIPNEKEIGDKDERGEFDAGGETDQGSLEARIVGERKVGDNERGNKKVDLPESKCVVHGLRQHKQKGEQGHPRHGRVSIVEYTRAPHTAEKSKAT